MNYPALIACAALGLFATYHGFVGVHPHLAGSLSRTRTSLASRVRATRDWLARRRIAPPSEAATGATFFMDQIEFDWKV